MKQMGGFIQGHLPPFRREMAWSVRSEKERECVSDSKMIEDKFPPAWTLIAPYFSHKTSGLIRSFPVVLLVSAAPQQ